MEIGQRLKQLRTIKKLSQGDVEKRTGLLRCYVSRVENGFTVPALETLEKFARALEIPVYQLFYEGESKPNFIVAAENGKRFNNKQKAAINTAIRLIPRLSDRDLTIVNTTIKQLARKSDRAA